MVTVFGVEANIDLPEVLTEKELEELGLDGQKILPGCQHGWFESSVEGGAKLHYRKFLPKKGKPKAIVVFAHGIHAHGGHGVVMDDGRKLNMSLMVEQCMSEGFALYSFDYYGHGYSEGTRFLVPGWEKNLKDLLNFVELATAEHDSQLPCFLWGESYGGCLAIHATRSYQNNPETAPKNFKGVLLQAPAIIGDLPPYPVVFVLRNLLAPYFPRWTPFFMPNPISNDRIWRDPKIIEWREEKQLVARGIDGGGVPFRLGTAANLLSALEAVREEAIPGFKMPFCIVHGTEDAGVPIEGSDLMWEMAETSESDRVYHRIEGGYHDLLADPLAEDVMDKLMAFMKQRVAGQ